MSDTPQSGKLLNRNAQQYDIHAAAEPILIRLRAGDFFKTACARAGVPYSTAKRWLRLGQGGLGSTWGNYVCREEHVWFAEEVARALAEVEGSAVDAWMSEIEQGNWQAARDFLARRFPQHWGNAKRRSPTHHAAVPDEMIQLVWGDEDRQIDYSKQSRPSSDVLPPADYGTQPPLDASSSASVVGAVVPESTPALPITTDALPSAADAREARREGLPNTPPPPPTTRICPQPVSEELQDRLQSLAFLAGKIDIYGERLPSR